MNDRWMEYFTLSILELWPSPQAWTRAWGPAARTLLAGCSPSWTPVPISSWTRQSWPPSIWTSMRSASALSSTPVTPTRMAVSPLLSGASASGGRVSVAPYQGLWPSQVLPLTPGSAPHSRLSLRVGVARQATSLVPELSLFTDFLYAVSEANTVTPLLGRLQGGSRLCGS